MRPTEIPLAPDGLSDGVTEPSARPRTERYDRVRGRIADAVLSYLPLAVAVIDRDLRLIYWNAQAATLWGIPPLMAAERPSLVGVVAAMTGLTPGQRERLVEFCANHIELGDRVEPESWLRISPNRERRLSVQVRGMGRGSWMVTLHDSWMDRLSAPGLRETGVADAWLDALTGLPNRRQFNQVLDGLLPEAQSGALLIDVNGLEAINDAMGRPCGDALLCLVARRLSGELRNDDLLVRLGGDAFMILVPDCAAASALAERLLDGLSRPFLVDGQTVTPGFGIGIAKWTGSADALLDHAVQALAAAKGRGANRWVMHGADAGASLEPTTP